MNALVHKNKATSRCSGQRHDVPKSFICNVAMFETTA